jgi:hypothetical protein
VTSGENTSGEERSDQSGDDFVHLDFLKLSFNALEKNRGLQRNDEPELRLTRFEIIFFKPGLWLRFKG